MKCPPIEELPVPGEGRKGWPWDLPSESLPRCQLDGSPWPKVTIVTPSFNQGQYLEETIRSVLLQGYPDLDYIIIDGASTDQSLTIIKKYEKWLTYWESQPDRGQCHAINKGWARSQPGIWAWLNSDDTYLPGTIVRAVCELIQDPTARLVYASVSHTDINSQHLYFYYGRPLPPGLKRLQFWKGWNIPQPTTFFYSELVDKYGGLDETFHLALDYELFTRFSQYAKFKFIDETWATTRLHDQAKTGDWNTNKFRFFKEIRVANKKNLNRLNYYYLLLLESGYNIKTLISKNSLLRKLKKTPTHIPSYQWGTILQFGKYGNAEGYKKTGWSPSERYGTWTNGKQARLIIPLQKIKAHSIKLQINLKAFLCPGQLEQQRVKLIVNDQGICNWVMQDQHRRPQITTIPHQFLKKKQATIDFFLPDATSPFELGFKPDKNLNPDKRLLGIYVHSLQLTPNNSNHQENLHSPEMKKIIFIREIFDWMGTHSAYDPLCNHVEASEKYHTFSVYRHFKSQPSSLKTSLYSFIHKKINPNLFYNVTSLRTELSALKKCRKQHGDILHIMYGENNYGILGRTKKWLPGKLVVTFHQTPEWWETNYRDKNLLSLIDSIIVVSQSQVNYFEQFLPGRVSLVPLGIDTAFFNPGPEPVTQKIENRRIVFSGHWMRDIKTLSEVVKNLLKHNPGINFDFLVPKSRRQDPYFKELENFPQVSWHASLADEELRTLYQQASLLFIPYLDCTASCALLEAMSCGLPIVSSRVGGIPDYTHPSFAELLPVGDVNGFTRAIIDLIDHPGQLCERSTRARKYAQDHFAWEKIANQTIEVYHKILRQN